MSSKSEIVADFRNTRNEVVSWFTEASDAQYNSGPEGKWAAWQHLEHLEITITLLTKALGMAKFKMRAFGKPNRPVRSYEEVVERFLERLEQNTGTMPDRFSPSSSIIPKEDLVARYQETCSKYERAIEDWSEENLDSYLLPHPAMGRLIIREYLLFTKYHQLHHLRNLKANYI